LSGQGFYCGPWETKVALADTIGTYLNGWREVADL
jgi:hypothetical protein